MPAEQPEQHSPRNLTLCLLFFALLGICYRNAFAYDQAVYANPSTWLNVLHGTAPAPDQYRIGVVFTAFWISNLTHVKLGWIFAILDGIGGTLAIAALYNVLERSPIFRRSTNLARWLAAAAFAATVLFYLQWVFFYARIETLPIAGMAALLLWLLTSKPETPVNPYLRSAAFLIVSIALALTRADLALCIALGLLLTTLIRSSNGLSLPRSLALWTSLIALATTAAIQIYLTRIAYPQATYGYVHIVMFLHDYYRPHMWFAFSIFLAPFLWTLHKARELRTCIDAPSQAFLFAALAYLVLWITFGRLNEVRIFLPIALALTPLLAQLLILNVEGNPPVGTPRLQPRVS